MNPLDFEEPKAQFGPISAQMSPGTLVFSRTSLRAIRYVSAQTQVLGRSDNHKIMITAEQSCTAIRFS